MGKSKAASETRLGLTIDEASEVIGIGRSMVYRSIANGSLPARKIGNRTVVLREDAVAFLRAAPSALSTIRPQKPKRDIPDPEMSRPSHGPGQGA